MMRKTDERERATEAEGGENVREKERDGAGRET